MCCANFGHKNKVKPQDWQTPRVEKKNCAKSGRFYIVSRGCGQAHQLSIPFRTWARFARSRINFDSFAPMKICTKAKIFRMVDFHNKELISRKYDSTWSHYSMLKLRLYKKLFVEEIIASQSMNERRSRARVERRSFTEKWAARDFQ